MTTNETIDKPIIHTLKIIPIYSTNAVYGAMNKKVADKETTHQKREAFRKKTSNWKWFWQKDKK